MKRIAAVFVFLAIFCPAFYSFTDGQNADVVLGKVNFTTECSNIVDANSIKGAKGICIDTHNDRVYVADTGNNRVLWWNGVANFTTGKAADGVIGQQDMNGHAAGLSATTLSVVSGITVDNSNGDLYVADMRNNRVLKYNDPVTTGMAASVVLGQPDMTSKGLLTAATGMRYPTDVAIDSAGKLYVSEDNNRRVIRFTPPFTTGMAADLVIGKLSMTTSATGLSSILTSSCYAVEVDNSGNLYVADQSLNKRVLRFNGVSAASAGSTLTASAVFGKSNFISNTSGSTSSGMYYPSGLALDGSGNIFISDYQNNRVMKYTGAATSTNGPAAVLSVGQTSPDSYTQTGLTAISLNTPYGIAIDGTNNLYVCDSGNNRVLKYAAPAGNAPAAAQVIGQRDMVSSTYIRANSLAGVSDSAYDRVTKRLYVADRDNRRVLWWNTPSSFSTGKDADGIIGQADFISNVPSVSASALFLPCSVAVDSSGNLFVADANNNRVLKYNHPVTSGMNASVVIGQPDMDSNTQGTSINTLNYPQCIRLDSAGNLYVADTDNRRILKFNAPLSTNMNASVVLGQVDMDTNTSPSSATAQTISYPTGIEVDSVGNLYVVDNNFSRVTRYSAPLTDNMAADLVIGQADFISSNSVVTRSGLNYPWGLTFDGFGNLYVADMYNARVLKYTAPLSTGMNASQVLGQVDFVTDSNAATAGGLSRPANVCIDEYGNMHIADSWANRVLTHRLAVAVPVLATTDNVTTESEATLTVTGTKGDVTVVIPANTFTANVSVTVTPDPTLPSVPATQTGFTGTNVGVEITMSDATLTLKKPVTLTVGYRTADIVGLTAGKLVLCYYNTTSAKWIPLPSVVDETARTVQARVTHFSLFQIMQVTAASTLDDAKAYPNPFLGGVHPLINFMNLTAAADVSIYTLRGEKVAGVVADSAGLASWDGRAASGALVGPGIYLAFINDGVNKKTIKLAVER